MIKEVIRYQCTFCNEEFNTIEDIKKHNCVEKFKQEQLNILKNKYFKPNVYLSSFIKLNCKEFKCAKCDNILFKKEKEFFSNDPYGYSTEWEWKTIICKDIFYAFDMGLCKSCYDKFKMDVLLGLELLEGKNNERN